MASPKDIYKKGSLDLLILSLLSVRDCYGYQLTQLMKDLSEGVISVPSGSLYPALYKLENAGYISEYTVKSGKRRQRIYYHIEEPGRKFFAEQLEAYNSVMQAIQKIFAWQGDEHDSK